MESRSSFEKRQTSGWSNIISRFRFYIIHALILDSDKNKETDFLNPEAKIYSMTDEEFDIFIGIVDWWKISWKKSLSKEEKKLIRKTSKIFDKKWQLKTKAYISFCDRKFKKDANKIWRDSWYSYDTEASKTQSQI